MSRLKCLALIMLATTISGCNTTEPAAAVLLQVEVTHVDAEAGLVHGSMRNVGEVALEHGACPAIVQRSTEAGWAEVAEQNPPPGGCPAVGLVLEPGKRFEFSAPVRVGTRGCQYRLQVMVRPVRDGISPPAGDRELLLGNSAPFCID